jgi:hypothetical protein
MLYLKNCQAELVEAGTIQHVSLCYKITRLRQAQADIKIIQPFNYIEIDGIKTNYGEFAIIKITIQQ